MRSPGRRHPGVQQRELLGILERVPGRNVTRTPQVQRFPRRALEHGGLLLAYADEGAGTRRRAGIGRARHRERHRKNDQGDVPPRTARRAVLGATVECAVLAGSCPPRPMATAHHQPVKGSQVAGNAARDGGPTLMGRGRSTTTDGDALRDARGLQLCVPGGHWPNACVSDLAPATMPAVAGLWTASFVCAVCDVGFVGNPYRRCSVVRMARVRGRGSVLAVPEGSRRTEDH